MIYLSPLSALSSCMRLKYIYLNALVALSRGLLDIYLFTFARRHVL
jgi:hypothetical protein